MATFKDAVSEYYGRTTLAVYIIGQLMAEDPNGFIAEIHLRFLMSTDD